MNFNFQRLIEAETWEYKNIEWLTTIQADQYECWMKRLFSMKNKDLHVTINDGMHVWFIELLPFYIQSYESMNKFLPSTDIEFGLKLHKKKRKKQLL